MFFRSEDLDPFTGVIKSGVAIEPLILRASAGECIEVALTNNLPTGTQFDLDGFNTMPMIVEQFNANQVRPSSHVGLHPQMVFFDVTRSDGMNVGFNPVQTAVLVGLSLTSGTQVKLRQAQTTPEWPRRSSLALRIFRRPIRSSTQTRELSAGSSSSLKEPPGMTPLAHALRSRSRDQAELNSVSL